MSAGALDNIMVLLRRLQTEGKTLLGGAQHARGAADCRRRAVLHQGHLMAQGTPQEIIADPALAEIYSGARSDGAAGGEHRCGLRIEDGDLRCVVRAGARADLAFLGHNGAARPDLADG